MYSYHLCEQEGDKSAESVFYFLQTGCALLPLEIIWKIRNEKHCNFYFFKILINLKHLPCNNILGQFPCLLQRLCLLVCAYFFNCCLTGLFEFFFKMSVYLFRDKGMSHESRNNFLPTEVSFGAAISFVLVFYFRL